MCSLSLMWCCVPQIRLEASVKLQRWWRRQAAEAAGRKAQRMLKETVRRMAQAKLRIAATNFQRLWRGVKGREQYQWIKVNHHASKIQVSCSVPRACVVECTFLRPAPTYAAQALWRGRIMRDLMKNFRVYSENVVIVQRAWRVKMVRAGGIREAKSRCAYPRVNCAPRYRGVVHSGKSTLLRVRLSCQRSVRHATGWHGVASSTCENSSGAWRRPTVTCNDTSSRVLSSRAWRCGRALVQQSLAQHRYHRCFHLRPYVLCAHTRTLSCGDAS